MVCLTITPCFVSESPHSPSHVTLPFPPPTPSFDPSQLNLSWPEHLKLVHSFLVVNGLNFEAARPECLSSADVNLFYRYGLFRAALPLVLLLVLPCLRRLLEWRERCGGRRRHLLCDKLELRESIIFQFQLASSWRVSFDLVVLRDGTQPEAYSAYLVAVVLCITQFVFLVKYAARVIIAHYGRRRAVRYTSTGRAIVEDLGQRPGRFFACWRWTLRPLTLSCTSLTERRLRWTSHYRTRQ